MSRLLVVSLNTYMNFKIKMKNNDEVIYFLVNTTAKCDIKNQPVRIFVFVFHLIFSNLA